MIGDNLGSRSTGPSLRTMRPTNKKVGDRVKGKHGSRRGVLGAVTKLNGYRLRVQWDDGQETSAFIYSVLLIGSSRV